MVEHLRAVRVSVLGLGLGFWLEEMQKTTPRPSRTCDMCSLSFLGTARVGLRLKLQPLKLSTPYNGNEPYTIELCLVLNPATDNPIPISTWSHITDPKVHSD